VQPIPENILVQFDTILKQRNIPADAHNDYRKWLRYFLDFRAKQSLPGSRSDQVRLFAEKLRSKNQTTKQQAQAADAVSLFFALQRGDKSIFSIAAKDMAKTSAPLPQSAPQEIVRVATNANNMVCEPPASSSPCPPRLRGGKHFDEWRCLRQSHCGSFCGNQDTAPFAKYAEGVCGLEPQVSKLPEKQTAGGVVSGGGEGVPYLSGGGLQGVLKSPEPGFQRPVVSVPARSEKGFWNSQRHPPREDIELYPHGPFTPGD